MITPNQINQIGNIVKSSSNIQSANPQTNSSDWYSNLKNGAYRVGQTATQSTQSTSEPNVLVQGGIGAAKGLGSSVAGLGELFLKGASKLPMPASWKSAIQGGIQTAEELKQTTLKPQTTAEKIGKTIEQIGEFFIPVGGEERALQALLTKVPEAGKLAQLGAKTLGSATEFAGKMAIQTGGDKGQVMASGALGATAPIIGAGASAIKNFATEKIPERLYSIIFKDAESDLRASYKSIANGEELNPTLAKEALDRGIKGSSQNMAVYSFQKLDQLENRVQEVVKSGEVKPTITIENKKGYQNVLNTIKDTFSGDFQSTRAKTAQQLSKELRVSKGNEITTDLGLRLRRFIDKMRNTSSFRANINLAPKQEGFKEATGLLRKKLASAGLGDLMNEERVYIQALDDIVSDAAKRANKNVLGLFDLIAGGGGMAAGSPLGGVSAALAVRGFQQPFTLTNLAQALYKMKNAPSPEGLLKTIPPLINQAQQ